MVVDVSTKRTVFPRFRNTSCARRLRRSLGPFRARELEMKTKRQLWYLQPKSRQRR